MYDGFSWLGDDYRLSMDNFTYLRDNVVYHILSLLPTKQSVQTSTLSKRWMARWNYSPFIEFDSDDYPTGTHPSKIVNKVITHHEQNTHTFHLHPRDYEPSDNEFEEWISTIITHNIRTLIINLHHRLKLPQCLFACKTLVQLVLIHCGDIPAVGSVYFPALKKLVLREVGYESEESIPNLISGCPVLEELSVFGDVLDRCCVSSPTLTRLVLYSKNNHYDDEDVKVEVKTPALEYLRLCFYMSENLSTGALDSLIEAEVDLYSDDPIHDNFLYSHRVFAFVGKLCNVKSLTLSTYQMAVPDSAFSALAINFHNLTELNTRADLRFVTFFLENASNLRALKIEILHTPYICKKYCYWMEPKRVPACLISHLETVTVVRFECSREHEFDMVGYILRNAKVLKRMEIRTRHAKNYKPDLDKKFEALMRLTLFERGSEECQLAFD